MRIESGPTRERMVRSALLFGMVAVFGAWFAYDGWITYPRQNIDEYLTHFAPEQRERITNRTPNPRVTIASCDEAVAALRAAAANDRRAAVERLYGAPPVHETDDGWYYFGPAALVRVAVRRGVPTGEVVADKPDKSEFDLLLQKLLGVILIVGSVWALWHLVRVLRTRCVLDDEGLTHNGRGPIRWDDMRALDAAEFKKRGWVDLDYESDGRKRRLRLDEYHLHAFNDILNEICARRQFANPLAEAGDGASKAM